MCNNSADKEMGSRKTITLKNLTFLLQEQVNLSSFPPRRSINNNKKKRIILLGRYLVA